ncbi:tRNA (5-methylaminomethyl-2-thiouridine)(34)-methyltransferase MnmD [Limibaculum sp. FT325]|uniref:tRNA (5-methylaminomethyl-2-thiouridine)(34)-methyltransferase MnmD n=1 Tax=Thermohalobaculum sediminis TaxID=2939436 RepID=UPI0020BFD72E|nr:tRNA (5-methylaminomethyl-2-thiouridine)(34)-methyltransferase MnmD [Limibaculum sediminis]MCL5777417.1 tRNA (5-methylaminomethyl-2-thiouridine)(34)-methyltransferase MnmD [Limibaculum sediminis]
MTTAKASDDLLWEPGPRGEVPVSRRHGDPFYARTDGFAEARHVFLDGNRLPGRWHGGLRSFRIAELGFGTGLNVLAAWHLWRERAAPGAVLTVTSFELAPLAPADMARALAAFPELSDLAARLLAVWDGRGGVFDLGGLALEVVEGDARRTVPRWTGCADAWFLDGFAPSRNPQMWEPALLSAVAARMAPGATLATYSAAGAVRRALAAAGLVVGKRPGFGAKREMCIAARAAA